MWTIPQSGIRPSPITVVNLKCKTGRISTHTDFYFYFSEVEHVTYSQLYDEWEIKVILITWQWLFGFLFFWFPKAPSLTRDMAAPVHVTAGIGIFFMTICTAETGLMEKSIAPNSISESQVINFTGLFILLFGVAVTVTVALRRISV